MRANIATYVKFSVFNARERGNSRFVRRSHTYLSIRGFLYVRVFYFPGTDSLTALVFLYGNLLGGKAETKRCYSGGGPNPPPPSSLANSTVGGQC